MNSIEIKNRIAAIQTEVKGFNLDSLSNDDYAKLVALDTERKGLEVDLEKADNVERIKADAKAFGDREGSVTRLPGADAKSKTEVKSLGEQFFASPSRKVKGVESQLNVEVKTLMTTTAGVPYPSAGNQGVVVYKPSAPTTLLDVLETIPANPGTGYRFYQESLYTNNADTVLEAGTYPESALRLIEVTAGIYKVATWIPVTDEQLSDIPGAAEYIDGRLRTMVRSKAAAKAMSGSGTNDVAGILNVTGILTQAKATDTVLDAIYKAMMKVSDVGTGNDDLEKANVDTLIMHPTDWATLRLAKDSTGNYLLGDPAAQGVRDVWGVPVILDNSLTVGTALALDSKFFKILLGDDVTVQQTNSHVDYFVKGINAVRAQIRMGMVPLRPSAAVTITGLNA